MFEAFGEALRGNPVIPAVRGIGEDLGAGLSGDHPGVFVLGGSVFDLVGGLDGRSGRPPVCVNVDLITIQKLFALDLSTIERGLRLVRRAKPRFVEVLPALAYPAMASRHPETREWPMLGGLLKTSEEVTNVLDAVGVSTSHRRTQCCREGRRAA